MTTSLDILMITYNRPAYTQRALGRLLDEADAHSRVWVWHNGDDAETFEVVQSFADHARLRTIHRSPINRKLREPTNWFWRNADAALLGKVDDDCLVPEGWIETLRGAHGCARELGVVSAWPFRAEDDDAGRARRKSIALASGQQIMRNAWTGGSGYIMKRACVEANGPLGADESFSQWCIRLALRGWINGWAYPFLYMEHMDDPRSPFTALRTDADFARRRPLNTINHGVETLEETRRRAALQARYLQRCHPDARWYVGLRSALRRRAARLLKLLQPDRVWAG